MQYSNEKQIKVNFSLPNHIFERKEAKFGK